MKSKKDPRHRDSVPLLMWIVRIACLLAVSFALFNHAKLQSYIDYTWRHLSTNWAFKSVYFETWWVIVCYPPILFAPYAMSKLSVFDKYKIDRNKVAWNGTTGKMQMLYEIVEYAAPLMLLDTVMVKRYCDVDPTALPTGWIQTLRALPLAPPSVLRLVVQLVGSFVIYDAIFCAVHYALHRNALLYRLVHATHHTHDKMFSRVTNKLTAIERLVLVLAANQALKLMHGHPLTRALFVPLFVSALVWNHSGYDVPWSVDKVVPFSLLAGSAEHYAHHVNGEINYQPFLTYIDRYLKGR